MPVPANYFWNAVATNNMPALQEFKNSGPKIEDLMRRANQPERIKRLAIAREKNLSHRIVASAEYAKIQLSQHAHATAPMAYIEEDFAIEVSRSEFADAIDDALQKFRGLIDECKNQANTNPEVVYVTGGTAKSPLIADIVEQSCSGVPIVTGNHFGSVASGLATWANRIF